MLRLLNRTAPIALAALNVIFSPAFANPLTLADLQKNACTGYDGLDPVAIASDQKNQPVANIFAESVEQINGDLIFKFNGNPSVAFIFYTPFLYDTVPLEPVTKSVSVPTDNLLQKEPYIASLELTFVDKYKNPIGNGIVDFTAFYPGSIPFTMTTTNDGKITITCINNDDSAVYYNIRKDDGSFLGEGSLNLRSGVISGDLQIDPKDPKKSIMKIIVPDPQPDPQQ